MTAEVKN